MAIAATPPETGRDTGASTVRHGQAIDDVEKVVDQLFVLGHGKPPNKEPKPPTTK